MTTRNHQGDDLAATAGRRSIKLNGFEGQAGPIWAHLRPLGGDVAASLRRFTDRFGIRFDEDHLLIIEPNLPVQFLGKFRASILERSGEYFMGTTPWIIGVVSLLQYGFLVVCTSE